LHARGISDILLILFLSFTLTVEVDMSRSFTFSGSLAQARTFLLTGKLPEEQEKTPQARKAKKAKRWQGASKRKLRKLLHNCIVCGERGESREVVVSFSLDSGAKGEMAGRACLEHQPGDSWRGLGTVDTILVSGVRLQRARGEGFNGYSIPLTLKATLDHIDREKARKAREKAKRDALDSLTPSAGAVLQGARFLREQGKPITSARLAEYSGTSSSTIRKGLKACALAGLLTREKVSGRFVYTITPLGL